MCNFKSILSLIILLGCNFATAGIGSKNTVEYKIPIWDYSSADTTCITFDAKFRAHLKQAEQALSLPENSLSVQSELVSKFPSERYYYHVPPFYCAFHVTDHTGLLSMKLQKSKSDLLLNKEDLESDEYCKEEYTAISSDPRNLGAYRFQSTSLGQGDFCTVKYLKIRAK